MRAPSCSVALSGRILQRIGGALLLAGLVSTPIWGRPHLLIITLDTTRADRLGCYGYTDAGTPVLDRLAGEGIRFESAFSPVPLTLPAHASILTGMYPLYHGIRDNSGYRLSAEHQTLAETLKREGYQTAAVVGAFVLDSKFGLDQGFDYYFDNFDLSKFEKVSPGYIQRRGDEVVREALHWLDGRTDQPFFLWVHLFDPHDPYTPPEPYASRHPGRPYDGEVEFTDANVGRLLDWLKAEDLYDKTLVVVVGDHGESLGEHGEGKHGLFIYNATQHVPLIFRLPGAAGGSRVVAESVSTIDLYPTIVQLLEVDRGDLPEVQGRGLASLLLGRRSTAPQRSLYAESYYPYLQFGWSPLRALISGSYKYILAPEPELYNLSTDSSELQNLATQEQALAARLRRDLENVMTRLAGTGAGEKAVAALDASTLERLQALGYVALSAPKGQVDDGQSRPNPRDQIGLYNRILDLFEKSEQGRYQETISGYRQILQEQPQIKIVRYKLGQAYFYTGRFDAALEQFKTVIEQAGEDPLATFDMAQAYLRLNRLDEAALGFKRTLEIDPTHYRARTNLGVIYKNQGKIPQAIEELEKARSIAPASILTLGNLGVAYSIAGRHEEALEVLRKATALDPENAILHANLGMVLRRMGREQEAEEELNTARRLNPDLFKRSP